MLAELLSPLACVACGAAAHADLCAPCAGRVRVIAGHRCERCGAPCSAAAASCALCAELRGFRRARSLVVYGGPATRLALSLKHRGRPALARHMGALLADLAIASGLVHDEVVFVPAGARSGRRGFDHASLLARAVASRLGRPVTRALSRTDHRPRQSEAPATQRRANAVGAFAARPVRGALLLVDDVMTTGATIEACATALVDAGAAVVDAITWARTLRRSPPGIYLPGAADPQGSRR